MSSWKKQDGNTIRHLDVNVGLNQVVVAMSYPRYYQGGGASVCALTDYVRGRCTEKGCSDRCSVRADIERVWGPEYVAKVDAIVAAHTDSEIADAKREEAAAKKKQAAAKREEAAAKKKQAAAKKNEARLKAAKAIKRMIAQTRKECRTCKTLGKSFSIDTCKIPTISPRRAPRKFPAAVKKFIKLHITKYDRQPGVWQCPVCGRYYEYITETDTEVGDSHDWETLTRITKTRAKQIIKEGS